MNNGQIMTPARMQGHRFITPLHYLLRHYEHGVRWYVGPNLDELRIQGKTVTGRRTHHLMGLLEFIYMVWDSNAQVQFFFSDESWLYKKRHKASGDPHFDSMSTEHAIRTHKDLVAMGKREEANTFLKNFLHDSVTFTREDIQNAKDIVGWLGLPIHETPADNFLWVGQALERNNPNASVFSVDVNFLAYGVRQLSNFSNTMFTEISVYPVAEFMKEHNLTHTQFRDFLILRLNDKATEMSKLTLEVQKAILKDKNWRPERIFEELQLSLDFDDVDWRAIKGHRTKAFANHPVHTVTFVEPKPLDSVDEFTRKITEAVPGIRQKGECLATLRMHFERCLRIRKNRAAEDKK